MDVALGTMDADAFLTWRLDRDGRWELKNFRPWLKRSGFDQSQDMLVVNVIGDLAVKLRGSPFDVLSANVASRTAQGDVIQPDVTVDHGPSHRRSLESAAPTAFFEVLSRSTRAFDIARKPEEYKRVPTLRHIVLLDPDLPRAMVWNRADEEMAWTYREFDGLDGRIDLPAIAVELPMAAIYDGVVFEAE